MAYNATYHSIWDNGFVEIISDVEVNWEGMTINEFSEEREVIGADPNSVDDTLDILDEEFVETEDGTRYTASPSDTSAYDEISDEYGNGIVYYDA